MLDGNPPCRDIDCPLCTGLPQARVRLRIMALKPQPNHAIYLEALRRMPPRQRLAKAFELSENTRQLFRRGLRRRFPHMSEEELDRLYLKRLSLCHNRNY